MNYNSICQIIDMSIQIVDTLKQYIEKDDAEIEVIKELVDNLKEVYLYTNKELFLNEKIIVHEVDFDVDKIEDFSNLISDYSDWMEFIKSIVHERKLLKNNIEVEFYEIIDYARYVDGNDILRNSLESLKDNSEDMIVKYCSYYQKFSYLWGSLDPVNDNYDVLISRICSLKEKADDFVWLFNRLGDYRSKFVLVSMIKSWLYFDMDIIMKMKEFAFKDYYDLDILECDASEVMVDVGAFTGDSALDYISTYGRYKKIYCYEITPSSCKKIEENLKDYNNIIVINKGLGEKQDIMRVEDGGEASANRASENGSIPVDIVALDEDITEKITLLKMDIEGAEQSALKGCVKHIKEDRPKLLICVYHNNRDIVEIPRFIDSIRDDYKFYLRSNGLQYGPSEIVLFGV